MIEKRIAYYTRKVAEFGEIHPSKRRNPYRYSRLEYYRLKLKELIVNETQH